LPLLSGGARIPAFLEDKVYIDFRKDYFHGLGRLAATIHEVPKQHFEEAIRYLKPCDLRSTIEALRFVGIEPYVVLSKEDAVAIRNSGGTPYIDDRVRFCPEQVMRDPNVTPRVQRIMTRLIEEVW